MSEHKTTIKEQVHLILVNWFTTLGLGETLSYISLVVLTIANFRVCEPALVEVCQDWTMTNMAAERVTSAFLVILGMGIALAFFRAWRNGENKQLQERLDEALEQLNAIDSRKKGRDSVRPPTRSQQEFAELVDRWMSLDEIGDIPFEKDDQYLKSQAGRVGLLKRYKIRRVLCGADEGVFVQNGNMFIGRVHYNSQDASPTDSGETIFRVNTTRGNSDEHVDI